MMALVRGRSVNSEAIEANTDVLVVGVLKLDPWLEPFKGELRSRFTKAQDWIKKINNTEGGLEKFSRVRCVRARALNEC